MAGGRHNSAAFTLDIYRHLMDRVSVRPVEWIDDLVFSAGAAAALKLHHTELYRLQPKVTQFNGRNG